MQYEVRRLSEMSRRWLTADGRPEIIGVGNEHDDLYAAAVEADARNMLEGEGQPRWSVVDIETGDAVDPWEFLPGGIETEDVYDYLVDDLGLEEAEALRLIWKQAKRRRKKWRGNQ